MKKVLIAGLIAGSLTITGGAVSAPNGPHMRPQPPGMEIVQSLRGLSLTDEQIAQIKELLTEFKENNQPFDKPEMPDLTSLLTASENEIRSHIESQVSAIKGQRLALAQLHSSVYSLLTTEQKEKLEQRESRRDAQREKMQARMNEHQATGRQQDKMRDLPFKGIELSDEQLASIQALNETFNEKKAQHKATIDAFREAEKALIRSGNFSETAWETIRLQYYDAMIEVGVERATHMQAMLSILTDEQREQLQQQHDEDEALKQLVGPEH